MLVFRARWLVDLPGWSVALLLMLSLAACTQGSTREPSAGPDRGPAAREETPSQEPTAIAAGAGHSCVLRDNGRVVCWGANKSGQLGDGSSDDRSRPTPVVGISDAVELALGREHSCARRKNGAVACWGSNARGQLGDGSGAPGASSSRPVAVRGLLDARALASGDDHVCALREGGAVVCWGANADGQLGNKTRSFWNEPAPIRGLADATGLAAGARHSCAQRQSGAVICWGANDKGQLGDGSTRGHERPAAVSNLPPVAAIAAAGSQTCGVAKQAVLCWGEALGGKAVTRPRKLAESGGDSFVELELGPRHGCLRQQSGTVRCWGINGDGRLGDGTLETRPGPVSVAGLGAARDLALGRRHSCALREDGGVSCWGDDAGGALGQGDDAEGGSERGGVRRVLDLRDAIDLVAGDEFSCALRATGAVLCWGRNDKGQLGDGGGESRPQPVAVAPIEDGVSLASSSAQACAVRRTGAVVCWGANEGGQLGRAGGSGVRRPTPVLKITDATAVALGSTHGCALRRSGEVQCWGSDEEGQLGDGAGSRGGRVAQLRDAVELSAGRAHTCARRAGGTVVCWGANNQGQIGNSISASQLKQPVVFPASVTKVAGAAQVVAGFEHGCARLSTGKLVCWGRNDAGQLGSGTLSQVWTSRVPVRDLAGATALAIGPVHACAAAGARVSCWGDNGAGQAGFAAPSSPTPRPGVAGLEVAALALGRAHSCARLRSGEVACWGSNEHGQLGDGGRSVSPRPVEVEL